MSFGGLGLIAATVPAELAVQAIGWRGLFLVSAGITVLVAVMIFLVVPEHPRRPAAGSAGRQIGEIGEIGRIMRDPFFWRLTPLFALTAGAHVGIHTLWAGPWFRDVAGFDREGVALHLAVIAVAFLAGTLMQGIVADRLGRRGVDPLHVMVGTLVLFLLAQIGILLELTGLAPLLWFVFGMTGQACILGFPSLAAWFGADLSGRAQTATNLLIFLCAFGVQAAIGVVIDLFPVTSGGGYDPAGYRWGFGIFFVAQLLALAWYFLAARPARADAGPGVGRGCKALARLPLAGCRAPAGGRLLLAPESRWGDDGWHQGDCEGSNDGCARWPGAAGPDCRLRRRRNRARPDVVRAWLQRRRDAAIGAEASCVPASFVDRRDRPPSARTDDA